MLLGLKVTIKEKYDVFQWTTQTYSFVSQYSMRLLCFIIYMKSDKTDIYSTNDNIWTFDKILLYLHF